MTQPNDPRKVKVIVELIDHTSKIAEAQRARRSGRAAGQGRGADHRPADPRGHRRPAQAGQEPAAQLVAERAGRPRRRRRDDRARHGGVLRRAGVGAADRRRAPTAQSPRPSRFRSPTSSNDLRRAPQAGGREVLRVEVTAQSPLLKKRPGVHRHPRRRRPRPAAPVGDAGSAARCRRDADDQRHQPGVHRARDDVHPAGPRDLPGGSDCRDEDRPVPALARDRRGQPGPSAAGGSVDCR